MAMINTGKLPLIKDVVKSILIEDGGVQIHFESGASAYMHAYTTERQYENFFPETLKNTIGEKGE